MNPQRTTPKHHPPAPPHPEPNTHNRRPHTTPTQPQQQTLWGFIQHHLALQAPPHTPPMTSQPPTPANSQPPLNRTQATPLSTPVPIIDIHMSQQLQPHRLTTIPTHHQCPLNPERNNDPWGDYWAMTQPTNLFRLLSKNTGTINLQNLDMLAITLTLMNLSASVFAAQETNVHWDADTSYHLHTQCCRATQQVQLAMSTSAESASDWFKPGGTITMALNNWTNHVISKGTDQYLG